MASHHVLLLGGHGKIAQLLTPLLLKRSWTVTSVIRTSEQTPAIEKLGAGLPGKLNVLVRSIEDVTSQDKALSILNEVKPDYIAWSAGAGGKGGAERTFKVDRDAAVHFINAAASVPTITKFLLISYLASRRSGASWWPAGEWDEYNEKVNNGVLSNYYKAKIEADEVLYKVSKKSPTLVGIDLRPGTLTDDPATKVEFGKTKSIARNGVSREAVAEVASHLLAADGVKNGWYDLLDGDEDIPAAVERVVRENVDAAKGEAIYDA
ncbi:NAD dependent epimerase dehydratase [Fusarium agapanthi]|uniref:NAD dependent epimerase dehydratase n=1 Tax=Fusarium agapanthi TaxID=1803897 RepID=A0A9P5B495_9HYPO|nr:NAD dependent epimerase dehydratase [Fusarium agapanthi]